MITELTKEQKERKEIIKNKWCNQLLAPLNEEQAREGINWIYSLIKRDAPKIYFLDSPMACQEKANEMKKTKNTYYSFAWYGSVRDFGWVAYYDFFSEIIKYKTDNFSKFRSLMSSGVYDMIQFDTVCLVSKNPVKVLRNENRKLHSTKGQAIEWADGYGSYRLHGVPFKKHMELYRKITEGSITYLEIFQLENIEHQRVALAEYGIERLFKDCKAKLIHKSDKGNELYKTSELKKIINEDAFFLRYFCPSTNREYISFTSPELAESKDADICMADKGGWSKEEYLNIGTET